jgi:hypothetical protein
LNTHRTIAPRQLSEEGGAGSGHRLSPVGLRDYSISGLGNSLQITKARELSTGVNSDLASLPPRRASVPQESGLGRHENTSISSDSRYHRVSGANVQGTVGTQAVPAPARGRAQSRVVTRSRTALANSEVVAADVRGVSNIHGVATEKSRLGSTQHRPVSGFLKDQTVGESILMGVEKPRTKKRKVEE